jgi:hypothetical protein
MSSIICPWCQYEILQEEGAEPEKYCPVCENELDGYRTITVDLERDEEDLEENADSDDDGDFGWAPDKGLREKNEDQLKFEEQAEKLLDEQDAVPECPHCREYMVEAGEQSVAETQFRPRRMGPEGPDVLAAPFTLKVYVCPACFAVSYGLSEDDRMGMIQRLGSQKS